MKVSKTRLAIKLKKEAQNLYSKHHKTLLKENENRNEWVGRFSAVKVSILRKNYLYIKGNPRKHFEEIDKLIPTFFLNINDVRSNHKKRTTLEN